MGKQFNKKITWVIKNFSSLKSEKFYSDRFVVDGCKCCTCRYLCAYPKGSNNDHLSLFLVVDNHGSLPIGWKRHAKYTFTVLNQLSKKLSRKHGEYDTKHVSAKEVDKEINMFSGCSFHLIVTDIPSTSMVYIS
ncbi:hypothetical protein DY000_02061702 [Brassica cretica]|uniref:MATH domain-containing protein n=1 Tax=Brassica cretica TaxID=69181 RepID=A0ABQ7AUV1_BRACR|nr:hypothetical protein DY000_02061702 [Brassica cretica]